MKTRDLIDLILLAALWGASFLFMRVAVPEFGAIALIWVRVTLAALFLLPIVWWRKRQQEMFANIKPISLVGLFNSAIPFTLIAYSTIYLTAGFASVLNAVTPMCAAVVAFFWLKQKLSLSAIMGLFIGLFGVLMLVWDKVGLNQGESDLAIVAGLVAAFCYAIAANYSKTKLTGVNSLAVAAGSQVGAAIFLLPLAIYFWPSNMPSISSWLNVIVLAVVCTGFAYILYFRLIESAGAANATSVTFLMPVFGLLWGNLFLDEVIQLNTIVACVIILLGTGLTTGIIQMMRKKSSRQTN